MIWLFATLSLIIIASVIAIWAKIENRKEKARLEAGELSADDFEIMG